MKKKRTAVIAGIDPGTTTAYAVLTLSGNPISVVSSKHLTFETLLREVTHLGVPLLVGTDRKKCPEMVQRFAARTGAVKVVPAWDISAREKNQMTRGFTKATATTNAHQKDALAAALHAHHTYEPLLKRVERTLQKEKKLELADEVTRRVVSQKISIKKALHALLETETTSSRAGSTLTL